MLVADNQLVQQPDILALQPLGNGKAFLPHLFISGGGSAFGKNGLNGRRNTHLIH